MSSRSSSLEFVALAVLILPLMLGCPAQVDDPTPDAGVTGGGGGGGGGGATDAGSGEIDGGSVSAEEAAVLALYDTYCGYLAGCGFASSQASCLAFARGLISEFVQQLAPSIEAGRIGLGVNSAQCTADIAALSCAQDLPLSCSRLTDGLVAAGGGCATTAECGNGYFCDLSSTCPGVCTAQVEAGQMAASSEGCLPPLYRGSEGTCVAPVAVGGSCAYDGMGEPPRCGQDSYCDSTAFTCVSTRPAGAMCSASEHCGGMNECRDGTCQAYLGVGEDCSTTGPCQVDLSCFQGSGAGECRLKASEGGACYSNQDCTSALFCVGEASGAGTCQGVGEEGARCEDASQCAGDLVCFVPSGSVGTCQQPRALGEVCRASSDCESQLYCAAGSTGMICQARLPVGAECTGDACVQSAFCSYDAATMKSFCKAYKTEGESCMAGDVCRDGFCDEGTCASNVCRLP